MKQSELEERLRELWVGNLTRQQRRDARKLLAPHREDIEKLLGDIEREGNKAYARNLAKAYRAHVPSKSFSVSRGNSFAFEGAKLNVYKYVALILAVSLAVYICYIGYQVAKYFEPMAKQINSMKEDLFGGEE